jgi:hypothetical protein
MKKLFLVLGIVFLSIFGCYDTKSIIVNNHSTIQTITFTLTTGYRTADYIVKPCEQFTYDLPEVYSHKMESYQTSPVIDSVDLIQEGDIYNFYDIMPILASIYNTLVKDVILSGNGAISTDPLIIIAQNEINTETIISKNPSFSAKTTDGFPVQVDYIFNGIDYRIILR